MFVGCPFQRMFSSAIQIFERRSIGVLLAYRQQKKETGFFFESPSGRHQVAHVSMLAKSCQR